MPDGSFFYMAASGIARIILAIPGAPATCLKH